MLVRCAFLSSTLLASLAAQPTLTSPTGFLARDANGFAGPRVSSNGRWMILDGETGIAPSLLKEVSFRPDYREHAAGTGLGRLWSNVSLDISEADARRPSRTFSSNPVTQPLRVFSGVVVWPDMLGVPATNPPAWGGANGGLTFPFTTPWSYTATADICLDFGFTGGLIIGGGAPAWPPVMSFPYFLDGVFADGLSGVLTSYGTRGCRDTGAAAGGWAMVVTGYGAGWQTIATVSHATAPNAPVVHALGLGGRPTGAAFPGVACERLFVDPTAPTLYFFQRTIGDYAFTTLAFPNVPGSNGTPMWFQAAWNDSATGQLKLTDAMHTTVVGGPFPRIRSEVVQADPALKNGDGRVFEDWETTTTVAIGYRR
jgi:hypothetical protein